MTWAAARRPSSGLVDEADEPLRGADTLHQDEHAHFSSGGFDAYGDAVMLLVAVEKADRGIPKNHLSESVLP